jgi:tetratricopeptide (TPR) repeat protein/tRNA A-37 threonylcarbamoyl transferase component Bud32
MNNEDTLFPEALSRKPNDSAIAPVETADFRPPIEAGAVIAGRYTPVAKIGEGGMGEVWVAQQTEPVKRKVALKLIKAGMDSRSVLRRFEQERQALALMDHPNIARVLDGGLTQDRRPFFVMELVNGLPLTKFCDGAKLGIRERLQLFIPVCQAVQHAHQKGIIHRDLKPSNILVTLTDGRPLPKVIDFGVAKATSGRLTDESLATQFGAIVGTLEYMSPEQAGSSAGDVDTRADIYSLGVILYELLTGLQPIDAKRLKKAALTEMIRVVKEEEPSKPSTRFSSDAAAPTLSALRQVEPRKLTAMLRGELDWVVMKCLEKQRDRRYETANGLARDIERYLANEMVEARPPSAGYRVRKFVTRHKGQVVAASLVLLALLAGIAGTTSGLFRTAQANAALAAKNAELAAEHRKVEARFELARQAIATFHTGVSEDALLKNDQFTELRTRLLKEAARFYAGLEKLLEGQGDATSRKTLAEGYFQLGELTEKIGSKLEALAVHRKALAVRRELAAAPGADIAAQLDVARSLRATGSLLRATGERAGALTDFEEQRDITSSLEAESPTDDVRAVLAWSHSDIGVLLEESGKPAEALTAHRRALAIRQKLADANPSVTQFQAELAGAHNNIGIVLSQMGKPAEALAAYRHALAIRQALADASPAVTLYQTGLATIHHNIGIVLSETGKRAEALEAHRHALAIQQKLVDANPAVTEFQSDLLTSRQSIGLLLFETGKPAEALELHRQVLAGWQKLADANPNATEFQSKLAWSHHNIGVVLSETGQSPEALEEYGRALAIRQKLADANPAVTRIQSDLAFSQYALGIVLLRMGKPAEPSFRRAVAIMERLPTLTPPEQFNLACFSARLAGIAGKAGSGMTAAQGRAAADQAMAALRRAFVAGNQYVAGMRTDSDLDALRPREDFQKLLAELEKNSAAKPEEHP